MTLYLVAVAIRDEPGALAWVSRNLAQWQVNLKGFVADAAGMQLLVTDARTLTQALDDMGMLYRITEVQEVVVDDRPGALAELCARLAAEGINIRTAFGLVAGQAGRIYLDVDDIDRAAAILAAIAEGPSISSPRLGRIAPLSR